MLSRLAIAFALILVPLQLIAATEGGPIPLPLPLFPPNNWWNTDISLAPVDSSSAGFIQFIGQARGLHPDFGGDAGGGDVYGFPFIIVDGNQAKLTVTFMEFGDQSDGVDHGTNQSFPFYPIPIEAITLNGWVEGGQPGNVDQRDSMDRHMLIVDKTNNALYELYHVWFNGSGWEAGSGAFFDMSANNRRPDTWTSADAAGLAILPGLVRYDEVAGTAEIGHAFRVTVRSSNGYVFPASHNAGSTTGALPMGARLRLKASKDISSYPADVQKIFRAFKKYGLIVADNGSDMYVSGTYDTRWDNGVLNPAFSSLTANDFEVIQRGWAPSVSLVTALPGTLGAGDPTTATITAYDSSYNVATGYRGTIHFTSSDGSATLPANYTFSAADSGTHVFPAGITLRTAGAQTVTATDTADGTITGSRFVAVGPATPAGLVATAVTTTQVNVSWNASPGAAQYEIVRASAASGYTTLTTTAALNYADTSVSAGATYLYKVRAIDSSSRTSPFSAPDAATTIVFTDDPLIATATIIKAVHVTELRQAVNLMRAAAGLGAMTFTDSNLSTGMLVKATHLQELRSALTPARTALGLSAISFTDSNLSAGTTVKAAHVQELRSGGK
ncbi:MAG TPA: fibronectin type III domain-containing protein [Thermoanaerobaculia bacterium]|nr:fibronectin type III domain-containing protein [Thermoanaerobaculia bacterium]